MCEENPREFVDLGHSTLANFIGGERVNVVVEGGCSRRGEEIHRGGHGDVTFSALCMRVRKRWRPWRTFDPMEKAGWWCLAAYGALAIAMSVAFMFVRPDWVAAVLTIDRMVSFVVSILLLRIALTLSAACLLILGYRRSIRRLRASRFRLCPGCLYNLKGVMREPRCPECGLTFGNDRPTRIWRGRFPNRKRDRRRR